MATDHPGTPPVSSTEASGQTHTLTGPILQFELEAELEELRHQELYRNGKPSGRTLVKEPDLRVVLFALGVGARMKEHQASGPISMQALLGTIRLHVGGNGVDLRPGQLVTLAPSIPHDVEAIEEGALLLTIGRTKYEHVSDQHEVTM